MVQDLTVKLENLMQQAGLGSISELSRKGDVAELQIIRLKNGLAQQMTLEVLLKISKALEISFSDLLVNFVPEADLIATDTVTPNPPTSGADTKSGADIKLEEMAREYEHLQQQLQQQKEKGQQEWQQRAILTLESWLIQWPTVAAKVRENPQVEAVKLLPLVRPVENLIKEWGLKAIGAVGEVVSYDPNFHQLMETETAKIGDSVLVRYVGYLQGNKLLYRAKVTKIN